MDGISDDWEVENGTDPKDASDGQQDTDGDGWTNLEHFSTSWREIPQADNGCSRVTAAAGLLLLVLLQRELCEHPYWPAHLLSILMEKG